MIQTLKKTLLDQQNLDELCADRDLITNEIFSQNAFYGISNVLKKYVKLPNIYPLKLIIPHGINLSSNQIVTEAYPNLPVVLCYPELKMKIFKIKTNKVILHSASPFLYTLKLIKNDTTARKGTIFFPTHSTHWILAKTDLNLLVKRLKNLDSSYHPITICLYWKNYNDGDHIPFLENGFNVVSAGHMFDPNFLTRIYHLCSIHKYSSSESIGSHIFYSIVSGCQFFFLKNISYTIIADDKIKKRDIIEPDKNIVDEFNNIFDEHNYISYSDQKQIAEFYLGKRHIKSASTLLLQIILAEMLYTKVRIKYLFNK